MKNLTEKVILLTSASKGIDPAIANTLAERSARVIINFAGDSNGAAQQLKKIRANGGNTFAI